ncbi:MAG: zf-HC2 domain-containing protein [Armatimonadota bacterium]|nr:zf-HC2 domain-containing protein [Armatimonadota bacterium]
MNCKKLRKYIIDYMDGALSEEIAEHVKAHLASCTECSQTVTELKATSSLVRSLDRVKAPVGFEARLHARLATRQATQVKGSVIRRLAKDLVEAIKVGPRPLLRPAVAVLLLCCLIGASVFMLIGNNNTAQATDQAFINTCQEQHISFAAANPLADDSAVLLRDRAAELEGEL